MNTTQNLNIAYTAPRNFRKAIETKGFRTLENENGKFAAFGDEPFRDTFGDGAKGSRSWKAVYENILETEAMYA